MNRQFDEDSDFTQLMAGKVRPVSKGRDKASLDTQPAMPSEAQLARRASAEADAQAAAQAALLVAERSFAGPSWLQRLRKRVARTPWLCRITALYGFYGEFAAALFLFPVARWPVTLAMTAMQVGIILFLGYVEMEWILLMFALTLTSSAALAAL